jgi:hypothetical protein
VLNPPKLGRSWKEAFEILIRLDILLYSTFLSIILRMILIEPAHKNAIGWK